MNKTWHPTEVFVKKDQTLSGRSFQSSSEILNRYRLLVRHGIKIFHSSKRTHDALFWYHTDAFMACIHLHLKTEVVETVPKGFLNW